MVAATLRCSSQPLERPAKAPLILVWARSDAFALATTSSSCWPEVSISLTWSCPKRAGYKLLPQCDIVISGFQQECPSIRPVWPRHSECPDSQEPIQQLRALLFVSASSCKITSTHFSSWV